ncbi:hypothetical protein TIFTF001_014250 [Ficus carica]|uniref:Uncharacterized protein n=1 Tax=Ficus carica TaxID=3494 RepID=A0AA88DIE9_FICCA|nr:hypothetical protein TIFTF001_014250 [Ficus carica]
MQTCKSCPQEGTKAAETRNKSSSYPCELVSVLDSQALCKPPQAGVGAGPASARCFANPQELIIEVDMPTIGKMELDPPATRKLQVES